MGWRPPSRQQPDRQAAAVRRRFALGAEDRLSDAEPDPRYRRPHLCRGVPVPVPVL